MYLSEDASVRWSFWQPDGLLMKVSLTFTLPVLDHACAIVALCLHSRLSNYKVV